MPSKIYITIALGYFFLATFAQATSFDCTQATTNVEKLICIDPQLSKIDEALAASYAQVLEQTADQGSVKKQQREWLSGVRNRCANVTCLRNAYTTRITRLASDKKAEANQPTKSAMSDAEACQLVADNANRGALNSLSEPPANPQPKPKELKRILGKNTELDGDLRYWSIDLDNDGVREHFITAVDSTMGVSNGYALSGKKGSTVTGVNDLEDRNIDLSVLAVSGRHYILSRSGENLGKLWRMVRNGEFKNLCKFSQREEPVVELIAGKENPICSEANEGRIPPASYSFLHALGTFPKENRFWSNHPGDGLARVDIDNDGRLDNVVRFNSSGSGGCDTTYLAVTDDTRTHIPDTTLNNLLRGELGTDRCIRNLDILLHSDATYIDALAWTRNRTIHRIKGNKAEMVCEFPGRLINEVVDAKEPEK
jgi:uncharacterized protein